MSTKNIRTQIPQTGEHEHSTPLYMTSSFVFDDAEHMRALFAEETNGNIYSRFTNPNTTEFVDKMVAMEGAEAGVATATGMAAGFASIIGLLRSGDHIVSSRAVFGSTHALLTQFLPRWGITHTFVDIDNNAQWEEAITESTKMLLVETPSNPGLDIADLSFLGALAARRNVILNVDNTFATPLLQRPINYGAHIVWHSATKWIDGQGRGLGGVVVGRADLLREIYLFARNTGPTLSPFNAWMFSKSLETLHVRLDRHCANALAVAQFLELHPNVERVMYPFLASHPQHTVAKRQMKSGGGIVSFIHKDGAVGGKRFVDGLKMASVTANIGDTRTIVTHPATSTHARLTEEARQAVGITQGLVRLSIGLEDVSDIIADIDQALQ
ncbi:MAG: aminotransferase class I/II-fold pyridoxal phosphate-dependent enzyme [Candidatus Kapabacteria bacterium]|nr:aminotransferase class I/II-fold pyridoxal phosphate-dependent enzyme [Candidatus Kapabacteria bacterium]